MKNLKLSDADKERIVEYRKGFNTPVRLSQLITEVREDSGKIISAWKKYAEILKAYCENVIVSSHYLEEQNLIPTDIKNKEQELENELQLAKSVLESLGEF